MSEGTKNIRLGLFVIIATILLITAFYFIGKKQNLFGDTFRINARFHNVNGLMQGNNVRYAGINVGTVESVEIVSDSTVEVIMLLEKKAQRFIKTNALASVGTDGLMGNKLVNINSINEPAPNISENSRLQTLSPIEMDEMVRTLNVTNENIKVISSNLRNITDKINSKNSLWNLLLDTIVAENVKSTVVNLKLMSNRGLLITGDLSGMMNGIKKGKGSIGALVTDTVLSSEISQTVVKLKRLSDTAAIITGDLSQVIKGIKQGKGTVGVLLNDTSLIYNLNKSMESVKSGAYNFNENMEAVKHSWPFKKYFRKKSKQISKK
ncbi:MAG: MCE family protein [Bacteroidia bacterium]|nr:MCE family protein [Bacteroidia bacterium]